MITNKQDLTLQALFSRVSDPRDMLDIDYVHHLETNENHPAFRVKRGLSLSDIIPSIEYDEEQANKDEEWIEDTGRCLGITEELWSEYDPYRTYFFGRGTYCDCCGNVLHPLNRCDRSYGLLCFECSDSMEERRIVDNFDEEMADE